MLTAFSNEVCAVGTSVGLGMRSNIADLPSLKVSISTRFSLGRSNHINLRRSLWLLGWLHALYVTSPSLPR